MRRQHRQAFTLVELLVVIGIIALLIAILLPSLNRARAAAQFVACASNMRQVGLAMRIYAGESRDFLPFGWWVHSTGPFNYSEFTWDDLINKHLGGSMTFDQQRWHFDSAPNNTKQLIVRVLLCPSDASSQVGRRSYSMNTSQHETKALAGHGNTNGLFGTPPRPRGCMLSQVRRETIVLVENPRVDNELGDLSNCQLSSPLVQITEFARLHNKRFNYLFSDGHVSGLRPDETIGGGTLAAPLGPWTLNPND